MDLVAVFLAASQRRYFWQHRRSGGNAFFFKNLDRIYKKMGRVRLLGRCLWGAIVKLPPPHTEIHAGAPQIAQKTFRG
jgi:hypothetical protein